MSFREVDEDILNMAGLDGQWRWLDHSEVTQEGDYWDFGQNYSHNGWSPADPGYTVMADEEYDVIRRVEAADQIKAVK